MDRVVLAAVGLSMKRTDYPAARRRLLAEAKGDRNALEVAHAVLMRDGLPRVELEPGQARGVRNRALNLLEFAIEGADGDRDGDGQFSWNQVVFDGS